MRILEHAVKKALERYKLLLENKQYRENLEQLVKERTEKLEKELKLRKSAEKKLRTSLNEKDVLLKEIHHRVKNNLQVISSLLNLQSGYINDKSALDIFIDSQNRVKSMALIHEKMYQSEDLGHIDFSEYIDKLATHLHSIFSTKDSQIKVVQDVQNVSLDINRAIPCGLIINRSVDLESFLELLFSRHPILLVSMSIANVHYRACNALLIVDRFVGLLSLLEISECLIELS